MTEFMFDTNPNDVPPPEETPFADVTNAYGTNTWEPLLESCQRILARLEATGELTSNEISDIASSPRHVTGPQSFEAFVWFRVCPTLSSHERVEWGDCWKFNPDKALSEEEYKAVASDFDIPAVHESHERTNADNDPRVHFPRVISGWHEYLREIYNDDTPRHGVAGEELKANPEILLPEEEYKACAEYLAKFPDIEPPSATTGEPDWVWVESDTESDTTATTEATV